MLLKNPRRESKLKRYELILEAPKEEYPERYASFTFGMQEYDPEYYQRLVPWELNPSVWRNKHNGLYTLRVEKRSASTVLRCLKKQHFWFNTGTYLWYPRVRKQFRGG